MKKMSLFSQFTFSLFIVSSIVSCSKEKTPTKVTDNCQRCEYTISTPSSSSVVCNIGDTVVTITTNFVTQTLPLNDITFAKYIDALEAGGVNCKSALELE